MSFWNNDMECVGGHSSPQAIFSPLRICGSIVGTGVPFVTLALYGWGKHDIFWFFLWLWAVCWFYCDELDHGNVQFIVWWKCTCNCPCNSVFQNSFLVFFCSEAPKISCLFLNARGLSMWPVCKLLNSFGTSFLLLEPQNKRKQESCSGKQSCKGSCRCTFIKQ